MTKCLSLDSNKSNVIPPLGHCLVTTVPGCNSGQPLKAGVRANKHCIYAHVPWRTSQLWEWQTEHMSWWLISCLLWMPFIWKYRNLLMKHAMPMHGFTKSRISYIFWSCSISSQITMPRVRARWRVERTETERWKVTYIYCFLLAVPGYTLNPGGSWAQPTADTQHEKHSKPHAWGWLAWSDQVDHGFNYCKSAFLKRHHCIWRQSLMAWALSTRSAAVIVCNHACWMPEPLICKVHGQPGEPVLFNAWSLLRKEPRSWPTLGTRLHHGDRYLIFHLAVAAD